MRPFAVVEGMLIASLAVALIAKPKPRLVSAAPLANTPSVKTIVGEVKKLGEGVIHSWVRTSDGRPSAVGVTFTESALRGLPTTGGATGAHEIQLQLPTGLPPFNQITVNYKPGGEFDFHFEMGEARLTIEPVIAKTFLQTRQDASAKISQPETFKPGVFPTSYAMKYDASARQYTVAIEGLREH